MKSIQRIILSIGLFLLFLSCVFVPWEMMKFKEYSPTGYYPFWYSYYDVINNLSKHQRPPLIDAEIIMGISVSFRIDTTRLILQLLAISFLTAFGVILTGIKKKS